MKYLYYVTVLLHMEDGTTTYKNISYITDVKFNDKSRDEIKEKFPDMNISYLEVTKYVLYRTR